MSSSPSVVRSWLWPLSTCVWAEQLGVEPCRGGCTAEWILSQTRRRPRSLCGEETAFLHSSDVFSGACSEACCSGHLPPGTGPHGAGGLHLRRVRRVVVMLSVGRSVGFCGHVLAPGAVPSASCAMSLCDPPGS